MWSPCARTAEVVDLQLEYGRDVEAMMPLRPGGEDWEGAEHAWCSYGEHGGPFMLIIKNNMATNFKTYHAPIRNLLYQNV